jgi:hypothetical protein
MIPPNPRVNIVLADQFAGPSAVPMHALSPNPPETLNHAQVRTARDDSQLRRSVYFHFHVARVCPQRRCRGEAGRKKALASSILTNIVIIVIHADELWQYAMQWQGKAVAETLAQ